MLFRFDDNGDTIWTRTYNDSANLEGWYVKLARKNRYIIGSDWANYTTSNWRYTPVLTETDSLGNRLWQKTYHNAAGPSGGEITGIDTCRDGGFIIAEMYYDSTSTCGDQIIVRKTDSLGNLQWSKQIATNAFCDAEPGGIIALKQGGYIVSGTIDTEYPTPWPFDNPALYLVKLNDNGQKVWDNTYGVEGTMFGSAILIMPYELVNGDIVVCGNDTAYNKSVGCILKTDSNGNQIWLRNESILSSSTDNYLLDIKPTPDGGYISTGYIYGSTINTWVVKTDSLGCADSTGCVYTGEEELEKTINAFTLYPNPSNGRFTLASKTLLKENEYVEIYNMLGQKIYKCKLNATITDIDISPTAKGIYLYRILSANGMLLSDGKFVIQ